MPFKGQRYGIRVRSTFLPSPESAPMFPSIPTVKAAAARVAIVSAVGLGALATAQLPAVADQPAEQYVVTIVVPPDNPQVDVPFDITGAVTPAAAGDAVHLQRLVGGRFATI